MKTILRALFVGAWLVATSAGLAQTSVVIEEVYTAYSNVWLTDEDGDRPAFIILRNTQSTAPFILDGYFLTDDARDRQKWQFPAGTRIDPAGEIIIFASGKDRRPPNGNGDLHTNFVYPCSVPNLILSEPIEGQQIDQERRPGNECVDCPGQVVISPGSQSLARYVVPVDDRWEDDWFTLSFDPNKEGWSRGGPCFGYESIGQQEEDCLVLYSTMDSGDLDLSKQTILDVSGSPIIHNGAYPNLNSSLVVPGQVADAIRVPADQQQYPRYNNHPELEPGTGEFAASIWVYPTGSDELQAIANKAGDFFNFIGWMVLMDNDILRVRLGGGVAGAGSFYTELQSTRPKNDEWTHILFRVDRTENLVALFVNGVKEDERSIPPGVDLSYNDGDLILGAATLGTGEDALFRGALDDFALWQCSLTDEEVDEIFAAGSQGESFQDNQGGGNNDPLATTPIYEDCYQTGVGAAMYNQNTSLWATYTFPVGNPSAVQSLRLFLKYDDGCVIYLNGQEVARRNYSGASPPPFNAKADADRPDVDALIPEFIDLTSHKNLLNAGGNNRLSIAGLNAEVDATRFLLCPILCLEEGQTPDQCKVTTEGREFWVAFPGNAPTDPSNPLKLSLCVRGSSETFVGVASADGSYSTVEQIVGGVANFDIPAELSLDEGETKTLSGVYVVATGAVSVYAETRIDYSTDAFTVLPVGLLGKDYWVQAYKNVWSDEAGEILNGTQFAICAAFDDTIVSILPTVSTPGNPGGGTITVNLDRGETYLVRSLNDASADLAGTRVLSSRPVAVYGGHQCANIPDEDVFFCDTVVEQLLPTKYWGTAHVTAPLAEGGSVPVGARPAGDVVRVMAAQPGTQVFRNGAAVAVLGPGEIYETVEKDPAVWNSEFPISVYQYAQSSDADGVLRADPFMALVQPRASWLSRYRICSPITDGFAWNYVNVVVDSFFLGTGSLSPIRVDGVQVPNSLFSAIGATGYSYARLAVGIGGHTVDSFGSQSSFPFGLLAYGFDTYDSYGYPGGMCFYDNEPPEIYDCQEEMVVYADPPVDQGAPTVWTVPDFGNLLSYHDPGSGIFGASVTQSIPAGTELKPGKYIITVRITDSCGRSVDCVIQLTVLPPWQELNFPNAFPDPNLEADVWGWDADPDGDGKTNLDEFRFGCDPNDPSDGDNGASSTFTPNPQGAGGTMTLTFVKRAFAPGLQYVPEGSADILSWESGDDVMELVEEMPMEGGEFVRMTFRALKSGDSPTGRYFVRARTQDEDDGGTER